MWGQSSCINVLKSADSGPHTSDQLDAGAHRDRYVSLYIKRRRVRSQAYRQNTKDYKNQNSVVFFNAFGTYYWLFHFVPSSSTFQANNPSSLYGTLWFVTTPDHNVLLPFYVKPCPQFFIIYLVMVLRITIKWSMNPISRPHHVAKMDKLRTQTTSDSADNTAGSSIQRVTTIPSHPWRCGLNTDIMMKQYTKLYLLLSQLPAMFLHSHRTSLETKHVHK